MVIKKEFERYGFDNIIAYTNKDITEKMLDDCFGIDRDFYDENYYWNKKEVQNTIKQFGQFCCVFYDNEEDKVIGYSFWFAIKYSVLQDFINKRTMLLDLKPDYCDSLDDSKTINLFLGGEAFVEGYKILELHKALEDIFQKMILDLARLDIKVNYIAMEACCEYDRKYLNHFLKLGNSFEKDKSTFYFDHYSPQKVYSDSIYASEIAKYYK